MTDGLLKFLKIAVVILIVIAVLMGGWFLYSKISKKEPNPEESEEEITLKWWVLWEDKDDMQYFADLYKQDHPNVTINIIVQVQNQYKEKVMEQINDGTSQIGPDIMTIHNSWLPLLQNSLSPIPDDIYTVSEYQEIFYPTAYSDFRGIDGKLYAIPLMFDGLGLYYNKTLLAQAGYTVPADNWDDFVAQVKKITTYYENGDIKISGVALGASSDNINFAFDIVSLLMLQEGAEMNDSTGSKMLFSTDPDMKAAKALKFYTDFVLVHKVWAPSPKFDADITLFTSGRTAMMFAPSWRVFNINDALETANAELNYDIAPVPQQPSISGSEVNWSDYWAEAVSSECEHPEIAWDFLKFMSSQEQLTALYEKSSENRDFGEIYPRKDMANILVSEKYTGAYIKMADTASIWRMENKDKMTLAFDEIIEEILGGSNSVNNIQNILIEKEPELNQILQSQK